MSTTETVPCRICDKPTTYLGTKECDPCHEVIIRLDRFLESTGARRLVIEKLAAYAEQGVL